MLDVPKKSNLYSSKSLRTFIFITTILAVSAFISANYFQITLIHGSSMEPTYHNMQIVILDKTDKCFKAGDVVAFYCDGLSTVLIKRIVAVPGDTLVINEKTLYVNGKKSTLFEGESFDFSGILSKELTLLDSEYIVIGDNIKYSKDSRHESVGIIKEASFIGKIPN